MRIKLDEKHLVWTLLVVLFIASVVAVFKEINQ